MTIHKQLTKAVFPRKPNYTLSPNRNSIPDPFSLCFTQSRQSISTGPYPPSYLHPLTPPSLPASPHTTRTLHPHFHKRMFLLASRTDIHVSTSHPVSSNPIGFSKTNTCRQTRPSLVKPIATNPIDGSDGPFVVSSFPA